MLLFRSVFLLLCLFACLSVCINLTMTARKYDCCCCLPKGDCHGKVTTGIVLLFSSVILLFRLAVCLFFSISRRLLVCQRDLSVCIIVCPFFRRPSYTYQYYAIQPIHVLLQDCNNIVAQSQLIFVKLDVPVDMFTKRSIVTNASMACDSYKHINGLCLPHTHQRPLI